MVFEVDLFLMPSRRDWMQPMLALPVSLSLQKPCRIPEHSTLEINHASFIVLLIEKIEFKEAQSKLKRNRTAAGAYSTPHENLNLRVGK